MSYHHFTIDERESILNRTQGLNFSNSITSRHPSSISLHQEYKIRAYSPNHAQICTIMPNHTVGGNGCLNRSHLNTIKFYFSITNGLLKK